MEPFFFQKKCDAGRWGTALPVEKKRIRFPMVSLEFFIGVILPAAISSWRRQEL
jgi:hypothetical protein